MNLQNLTQKQLVGVFTDIATAAGQQFKNPSDDLVVAEDLVSIAASLGLPGAEEAEVGIVIISVIATLLYPYWIPPWAPGYVPPNANQDPVGHRAR